MNMSKAKAAAYQTPVIITLKRKRKGVANDAMDEEDDQEEGRAVEERVSLIGTSPCDA